MYIHVYIIRRLDILHPRYNMFLLEVKHLMVGRLVGYLYVVCHNYLNKPINPRRLFSSSCSTFRFFIIIAASNRKEVVLVGILTLKIKVAFAKGFFELIVPFPLPFPRPLPTLPLNLTLSLSLSISRPLPLNLSSSPSHPFPLALSISLSPSPSLPRVKCEAH